MSKKKNSTSLSKDEIAIIKEAFDLYDVDHTGFADISEIKESLVNLGYEQKNPVLFDIIAGMDTEENARKGGVSFFQFIEEINDKLDDKETPEGLRRIFDMFSEGTDLIKKETVIEICKEIGKDYNDPELQEALAKCAKNATTLTFDEFVTIMTKKAYP